MNRHLLCAITALILAPLTGCGGAIIGNWNMVRANPNKEIFAVDDANFGRDGAYSATTTIEGKTTQEVGGYSFNGFKLYLRPQAGGQREYSASVLFGDLRISDGKERSVILRKTN